MEMEGVVEGGDAQVSIESSDGELVFEEFVLLGKTI